MSKKYEHLTREDLLAILAKRDARPKLGLVWERNELEHDKAINEDFVALDIVEDLSQGQGPYKNFVIEGDNFDALRYLNIAYKGRVKCIYIDPPYNTGNTDFVYNDDYRNVDDIYRHSTWLEFMYRRFLLAKDLLSDDGVILVSINDENRSKLELLMEQVYPGMRKGSFVWRTRSSAGDVDYSDDHEHVLVFANKGFEFNGIEKDFKDYKNPDKDPRGRWTSGDLTKAHTYIQRENTYYPLQDPNTGYWYPCNPDSVWRFASEHIEKDIESLAKETMEEYIRRGKILFPKNDTVVVWHSMEDLLVAIDTGAVPLSGHGVPLLRRGLPGLDFWIGKPVAFSRPSFKRHLVDVKSDRMPVSSWIKTHKEKRVGLELVELSSGLNKEGSAAIKDTLGGKVFSYPKPPSLIRGFIDQCTNANDIVLDFFAGSGTTAQAVLEANAEDQKNLRFILVSSTESTKKEPAKNICRDVTRARLKAVINGYKDVKGTGGSFAYMKVNKIPPERLVVNIKNEQIWTIVQQLHSGVVSKFCQEKSIQVLMLDEADLLFIPKITPEVIKSLAERVKIQKPAVIYSTQPGLIMQQVPCEHFQNEKVPDFLVEHFGGKK